MFVCLNGCLPPLIYGLLEGKDRVESISISLALNMMPRTSKFSVSVWMNMLINLYQRGLMKSVACGYSVCCLLDLCLGSPVILQLWINHFSQSLYFCICKIRGSSIPCCWGSGNPAESNVKTYRIQALVQERYWCFGTNYFKNTDPLGSEWITSKPHRLVEFYYIWKGS